MTSISTHRQVTFILILLLCFPRVDGSLLQYPDSSLEKARDKQELLNGKIWYNRYTKVFGDQYFLSNIYLKGSVVFNGKKYSDLDLLYDIANDDLILKYESYPVIILNKEMVDTFTLTDGSRTYKIINERSRTGSFPAGYVNLLYHGPTSLYVKYTKKIQPLAIDGRFDLFLQEARIYIRKDSVMIPVKSRKQFFSVLKDHAREVKHYIRAGKNKNSRLSMKDPYSFIPALRFYDNQ